MLSRKYLIFESENDGLLKYDTNYITSVILYKKMSLYDKEYSHFLHEEGYVTKNEKSKKMKLFNYSLIFYNLSMLQEGIKIHKGDEIKLCISGYDKPLNAILQGFSLNNSFNIDNINFKLKNIEDDKKVKFHKINIYKPLSPVIESVWNGKVKYLTPYEIEYYNALKQNLRRKYKLIYGKSYTGELKIMIENMLDIKPKTIKVKDIYCQGYGKFTILVQAEKDMQKVAYYCGLGQNNSMGAGFVQFITGGE